MTVIKRLQRRFVFVMMAMVTVVLLIVFSALIISLSNRMREDSLHNLDKNRMHLQDDQPMDYRADDPYKTDDTRDRPFGDKSPFSTFFVILDANNAVTSTVDFKNDFTEETITAAVNGALSQGKTAGDIQRLSLRYKVYATSTNQRAIGFIDISFEKNFLSKQILNYCFIGGGGLLAFFLVSLVLSAIAVRPVKKAWKQQQQFIADASHELKTPITVMLANTSILLSEQKQTKKEANRWISNIDVEAKHMKKLVEDLLFLARVDAKDKKKEHTALYLGNIVYESVLPFEALMFESDKKLDMDITQGIKAMGDAGQIKQLVAILLDNALKYSPKDTTVTVRLTKDNNKAMLSVNNQSEPIAKEDLPQIFDRFVRIDESRNRDQSSYGLGLAIAKEIVVAHKGRIHVDYGEKRGITFMITLPMQ